MKYHALTFLFLFLALDSYFLGIVAGIAMFITLGLIYEAVFWVRFFRGPTRTARVR